MQELFKQLFYPHAEKHALVVPVQETATTYSKKVESFYGKPGDSQWEKHFTGPAKLTLSPTVNGCAEWAILDIDDKPYSDEFLEVPGARFKSTNGKLQFYFRFKKPESIARIRELLTHYANMLGSASYDIFPSKGIDGAMVSLPKFGTEEEYLAFIDIARVEHTIKNLWDTCPLPKDAPLCVWAVAGTPNLDNRDEIAYKGIGRILKALKDTDVDVPTCKATMSGALDHHMDKLERTDSGLSQGCAVMDRNGLCAGKVCPYHHDNTDKKKVLASPFPTGGVSELSPQFIKNVEAVGVDGQDDNTVYRIHTHGGKSFSLTAMQLFDPIVTSRKATLAVGHTVRRMSKDEQETFASYCLSVAEQCAQASFNATLEGRTYNALVAFYNEAPSARGLSEVRAAPMHIYRDIVNGAPVGDVHMQFGKALELASAVARNVPKGTESNHAFAALLTLAQQGRISVNADLNLVTLKAKYLIEEEQNEVSV